MTTTATIEYTEAEISHRKACAYLKGYIVASSVKNGMKWNGDKERTPEFALGYEDGGAGGKYQTYAHILYNRLRHNKPHRTSGHNFYDEGKTDFDQSHIDFMLRYYGWTNRFNSKIANLGVEVKPLLNSEVA